MSELVNKILDGESVREVISGTGDELLFEMSNVLGCYCVTDHIDFSFFFSRKDGNRHGIRVKIKWNRQRFNGDEDGTLELHGDYKYISSAAAKMVSNKEETSARAFFKKYKVLFAAVWEDVLDQTHLRRFFEGAVSFDGLLQFFDVDLSGYLITDLNQLEKVVRENNLFNMND